jgi:glycosyltransferase involved in cell wall biosynthesis
MSREGLDLARVARDRGVPVVLSPICWFEPRALASLAPSAPKAAAHLALYGLRRALPRLPGWRRTLLALADRILPNSHAEAIQLRRLFGADPARIRVVPNGVDPRFALADPAPFRARFGLDRDFALYAGRVEPRKNVLGLVRAMRLLGKPLVVLGDPVPGHRDYLSACERAGQGILTRLPRLAHDNPLLATAYAAARVFALPSWFETPGLSALEAALAGPPVVITPRGCAGEYFEHMALYARPERNAEIASAIDHAWHAGPHPDLRGHVLSHFPWSHVAALTAEVYDELAR